MECVLKELVKSEHTTPCFIKQNIDDQMADNPAGKLKRCELVALHTYNKGEISESLFIPGEELPSTEFLNDDTSVSGVMASSQLLLLLLQYILIRCLT